MKLGVAFAGNASFTPIVMSCSHNPKPLWPITVSLITGVLLAAGILGAQQTSTLKLDTGKEIFHAACVSCHGPDGAGQADTTVGFEKPKTFPDFTDCRGSTPEMNSQWYSVIQEGGAARGFSRIMPAFGDALTHDQINKVIGYLRSFCDDKKWPQGDLNLPRPLFTQKAFPENEIVSTTSINTTGTSAVTNTLTIEKRLGALTNLEVMIPNTYQKANSGTWFGGIGDISVELKQTLFASMRTGSIFALAGEVKAPTGNAAHELGNGRTFVEAFGAYNQILPKNMFALVDTGIESPVHRGPLPAEMFLRTALGKSLYQQHGTGRMWTPMLEFVGVRELRPGARQEWDVVPEMQVTLSRRQHIRANVGVDIPFANTAGRSTALVFYLLWDWFDGSWREGWR